MCNTTIFNVALFQKCTDIQTTGVVYKRLPQSYLFFYPSPCLHVALPISLCGRQYLALHTVLRSGSVIAGAIKTRCSLVDNLGPSCKQSRPGSQTYVCLLAGLFVTVRAGTAYRHLFSKVKKTIICNVYI